MALNLDYNALKESNNKMNDMKYRELYLEVQFSFQSRSDAKISSRSRGRCFLKPNVNSRLHC